MQGTVNSPLKCTVQMDLIGLDMYTTDDGLHLYKGVVAVPALGMIDDVVGFNRCGVEAIISNAVINNHIESRRLEFGPSSRMVVLVRTHAHAHARTHMHLHTCIDHTGTAHFA